MRRLRYLLRDLAGRHDERFVALLADQVGCALEAAVLLRGSVDAPGDVDHLLGQITEIEERADAFRDELIEELATALTTPLDREDLFRLSRSLDDVVDNLRDFVDALVLFKVADASASAHLLNVIADGLEGLRTSVELLKRGPAEVTTAARATKRATRVRQAYLDGLVQIFQGDDAVEMLKQRELLRRLDVVGLRFGEATDALADAALKRV